MSRRGAARRRGGLDEPTSIGLDLGGEGDNPFATEREERHGMDPRARKVLVAAVALAALYVLALVVPLDGVVYRLTIGPQPMVPTEAATYRLSSMVGSLGERLENLATALGGSASTGYNYPQLFLMTALAGAGLAMSGAVYQGSFKNALVSPSTLGVMTGGTLGLVAWVVLFYDGGVLYELGLTEGFYSTEAVRYHADGVALALLEMFGSQFVGLPILSFAGCLLVIGAVLLVRRLAGPGLSGIMLIVTGQVVSGVIAALVGAVSYYYATTNAYMAEALRELQVATFMRPPDWVGAAVLLAACGAVFAVIALTHRRMAVLAFDEAEQRSMGVETRRMQVLVVGACTLLTAIVISFVGAVGFVGFMVPHLARRLVGPDFKYLLPATAVLGALFVTGSFLLVLVLFGTTFIAMGGVFISVFGAVVFLVTVLSGKGAARGAFR